MAEAATALDEGAAVVVPILVVGFIVVGLIGVMAVVAGAPALLAELLLDRVIAGAAYRRLRRVPARHWLHRRRARLEPSSILPPAAPPGRHLSFAVRSPGGSVPLDAFALVVGLGVGLLLGWVYCLLWKARYTRRIREDAVHRSLAVTTGKVQEQLVPYLPSFPYNPRDARFLGGPVDLVVFDGLSEGRVRRVVFLEVKTGGSALSGRERSVRDAVHAGAVEWGELRLKGTGVTGAA